MSNEENSPNSFPTIEATKPLNNLSGDKGPRLPDNYVTNSADFEDRETATLPVGQNAPQIGGHFAPGAIFLEKYEIIRLIGIGGMGTVYQAKNVKFPKMYAIKVINPNLVDNSLAIQRFEREARMMAEIEHPNAVSVFDYGVNQNLGYLVMEYLSGESLRDKLNRGFRLKMADLPKLAEQLCYVLGVLHRKQIIHRDLKPDNIFLQETEAGEVLKVLDFGIAKLNTTQMNLTQNGSVVGTPGYMSPEQCNGKNIDARADLYSLGMIFFELLTGKLPFLDDNPMTTMFRQVHEPPPDPRSLNPDISPVLAGVILKMIAKAPEDRFQTAHDVLEAIFKACGQKTPSVLKSIEVSRPEFGVPTSEEVTQPLPSSRPKRLPTGILVVAIAIAGILIVTLGWFALRRGVQPSQQPAQIPNNGLNSVLSTDFIKIPGGTYQIGIMKGDVRGLPESQCDISEEEGPQHPEQVLPFYIGIHEVTNREYREFVLAKNYPPPPDWRGSSFPIGTDDFPVTRISWDDATAYCSWRSEKEKLPIRLPSEIEWEVAAKGADGRLFPWGDSWNNSNANSNQGEGSAPQSVNKAPNNTEDKSPFGVLGLAGNVCEWTNDSFKPFPGSTFKSKPSDLSCKVVRGGFFNSSINTCRTTYRAWLKPTDRDNFIGFRIAVSVD